MIVLGCCCRNHFQFHSIIIYVSFYSLQCLLMDLNSQVLLGDVATGKSSLVLRFVKGQFVEFQVGIALCSDPVSGTDV